MTHDTILKFGAVENAEAGDLAGWVVVEGKPTMKTAVQHTTEEGTNDQVGYHGKDPGDPVICPAGSIAVFSSNCFHRSGTNTTSKMRRVYLAQYSAEPIIRPDGRQLHFADPILLNGQKVEG